MVTPAAGGRGNIPPGSPPSRGTGRPVCQSLPAGCTLWALRFKGCEWDAGLRAGVAAVDVWGGLEREIRVMLTEGHIDGHISYVFEDLLFCGDTLFNAGAGNCHNGGHPNELYHTFAEQLSRLPEATRIYPGHDYIANNLRFTLDREPDNARAKALLAEVENQDPADAMVTTLAREKEVNTFFRLTSPTVIARLREAFPDLPEQPSPKEVFLKLRELRNSW